MDVHARDVVAQLAAEGIEGQPQHFSWLSQLRMSWEDPPGQQPGQADKTIVVRMVNAQAEYGYEYLGASSRLVVTPLTDRCVLRMKSCLEEATGMRVCECTCCSPFCCQARPLQMLLAVSAAWPLELTCWSAGVLQVLPYAHWCNTPAHGWRS